MTEMFFLIGLAISRPHDANKEKAVMHQASLGLHRLDRENSLCVVRKQGEEPAVFICSAHEVSRERFKKEMGYP